MNAGTSSLTDPSSPICDPARRVLPHHLYCDCAPSLRITKDDGQLPIAANINWLTPMNAVNKRNHGLTTALRIALNAVMTPARVNKIRSSGHLVDVELLFICCPLC